MSALRWAGPRSHFKYPGREEFVLTYDDISTSKGRRHRGQLHYQQNGQTNTSTQLGPEGRTYCPDDADCSRLNQNRQIVSLTNPLIKTGMITRFFDPTRSSLRVYVEGPNGTYPGGRGQTFRVSYCNSKDEGASCNNDATETEVLVAHKLTGDQNDLTLRAMLLQASDGWVGLQTSRAAAVFSRKGLLRSSLSFQTKATDTMQYLVAGLAAGTYRVTVNGRSIFQSPVPVSVRDHTLYFEAEAGSVVVQQASGIANLNIDPFQVNIDPFQINLVTTVGNPEPLTGSVRVKSDGDSLQFQARSDRDWITVDPVQASTPAEINYAVRTAGMEAGTYSGTIQIAAPAAANTPQAVRMTVVVADTGPRLVLSSSTVEMQAMPGETSSGTVEITAANGDALPLSASVSGEAPWLTVQFSSTATPSTLTLLADSTLLDPGVYLANVTIASTGALNSPVSLIVIFTVASPDGSVSTLRTRPSPLWPKK